MADNVFTRTVEKLSGLIGKNKKDDGGEAAEKLLEVSYFDKPFLKDMKPKRRYEFFSDYFKIDDKFCTILTYIHPEGKNDRFGAFWGVNRLVVALPEGVRAI